MHSFSLITFLALLLILQSAHADNPEPGQGFIAVPGGPVWYRVTGEGEGIPLLTLHGGPGGNSCGFSLLDELGPERPVVRYDQLGGGRSGRPDDMSLWTVERFIEELHTVRSQLGLDEVHLLGHSWGGALAAAYVLAKGSDGVASVTFSSPLLSTRLWIEDANFLRSLLPQETRDILDRHELADTTDSAEYRRATGEFYMRHIHGGEYADPVPNCFDVPQSAIIYQYMWGETEFRATGTLVDFDLSQRLPEIDVPVLLLAGEHDEARPERMEYFQRLMPGSRFELITEAGHNSLERQPELYRSILRDFLREAETAR